MVKGAVLVMLADTQAAHAIGGYKDLLSNVAKIVLLQQKPCPAGYVLHNIAIL